MNILTINGIAKRFGSLAVNPVTTKHILSLTLVACLLIVCCANNKPKDNLTVTVNTLVVDKLPEPGNIPSEIIGKFDDWKIDSISCIENFDGGSRFSIRGTANCNIAKRKMYAAVIDVKTDSVRQELWSYIVMSDIAKDMPFELEAMYIPDAGAVLAYAPQRCPAMIDDKTDIILVSKQDMKLRMIKYHDPVASTFPIATGLNFGNKNKPGDKKTPEGVFSVYAIHDASNWVYDFNDGKGKIKGSYGKYFIRFKEHYHIGIHGTHLPETLGARATDGCVRMHNDDIEKIVPMVSPAKTLIVVTPAIEDLFN
jgi:hypothetical protein